MHGLVTRLSADLGRALFSRLSAAYDHAGRSVNLHEHRHINRTRQSPLAFLELMTRDDLLDRAYGCLWRRCLC